MATVKKGNAFLHAKKSGKSIAFKKKETKTAARKIKVVGRKVVAKKMVRRVAAVPRQNHVKYVIQVKKTEKGMWSALGLGGNSLKIVSQVAHLYAKNYPTYAFRIV